MREGLFEIQLLSADGKAFEESEGFVLASPGQEYSVRVVIHKDPTTGKFSTRSTKIKVGLYVDGVDVQYWKRIDLSTVPDDAQATEVKFWGFKQKTEDLKAFVFSSPKCTESYAAIPDGSRDNFLGQIQAVLFEAVATTEVFSNIVNTASAPTEHFVSDSKKFWQQASLGTCGGRSVEKEAFKPILRWNNASKEPMKTLVLSYHTKDMWELMQRFEKDTPVSNSSSSTKKRVIDLTDEDDIGDHVSGSSKERRHSESHRGEDDDDDLGEDEVRVISVELEVPMLDISGDDTSKHVWTALRVQRGI
jgi:hypothetical protein